MKAVLFVAALGLSPLAMANHYGRTDANLFFDIGQAQQDIKADRFPSGTDIDDEDIAFRVGIGMRGELLEGNISYIHFGQSAVTTPTVSAEAETYGLALDAVLNLPLSDYSGAFVRGGILSWEQVTDERVVGSGFVDRYYEDGIDPFWGVGFRFSGVPGMTLKVEYDRFQFKDNGSDVVADYELVTVGLEFLL